MTNRITRVAPSRRRPGHVTIDINGERLGDLPIERARALQLEVDTVLGEERRGLLTAAVHAELAYAAALRLLSVRPRSVRELMRRLRAKQHPLPAVAEAVGRLEQSGLVDDADFAEQFTRQRVARGYAGRRIVADLQRRGVERRVAERAVERVEEDATGTSDSRAEQLARRRMGQLHGVPERVVVRRTVAYLERRGFSGGAVVAMVKRLVKGNDGVAD